MEYPVTSSVMLNALRTRFGQATLQELISAEVLSHGGRILRMRAVANLWERYCSQRQEEAEE